MNKVAICLSGQPRCIEKVFPSIKKLIVDPNNADVFIHSWYDPSSVGTKFDGAVWAGELEAIRPDLDRIIVDLYKPTRYIFEVQRKFDISIYNRQTIDILENKQNLFTTKSMFYSIFRSNELKKEYEINNNFVYDYTIRCRFDIEFFNEINIDNYKDMLDDNSIIMPDDIPSSAWNIACNDNFAFGKSKVMDIYSSFYLHHYEMYIKHNYRSNEVLLQHWLQDNNISLIKLNELAYERHRR